MVMVVVVMLPAWASIGTLPRVLMDGMIVFVCDGVFHRSPPPALVSPAEAAGPGTGILKVRVSEQQQQRHSGPSDCLLSDHVSASTMRVAPEVPEF
jgi:hypothetical protein